VKWPLPVQRLFDWLEPPQTRARFEDAPGVGRFDMSVALFCAPVLLLTALVFAAPFLIAPDSTGDLSGAVGTIDNARVWGAFPEPAQWTYRLGDIACHTKATRSFFLNGNQMPFCARDVAIFAGAAVGLVACVKARSRIYRAVVVLPWWSYLALLVPIAVDGGLQDFLGFESDNLRRVVTGFPAGLAVAFALVFIAYEGHFALARRKKLRAKRAAARGGAPAEPGHDEGDSRPSLETGS
jgi:uncharacterized membrane protein